jgi:hypothetical protein
MLFHTFWFCLHNVLISSLEYFLPCTHLFRTLDLKFAGSLSWTICYHSRKRLRIFGCVVSHPATWYFLNRSLFRAHLHTIYYLWTYVVKGFFIKPCFAGVYVVTPNGVSISYYDYGIIPLIGPFHSFGPIFSYYSSSVI